MGPAFAGSAQSGRASDLGCTLPSCCKRHHGVELVPVTGRTPATIAVALGLRSDDPGALRFRWINLVDKGGSSVVPDPGQKKEESGDHHEAGRNGDAAAV